MTLKYHLDSDLICTGQSAKGRRVVLLALPPDGINIDSRRSTTASTQAIFPPLNLMALACALRRNDPHGELFCLDFNLLEDFLQLTTIEEYCIHIDRELSQYSHEQVDAFCISFMFSAANSFFVLLVERIRKMFPNAAIICGGNHATGAVEHILTEYKEVDFVICGEGEEALPTLIASLGSDDWESLVGVYGRENFEKQADGVYKNTPFVKNIDIDFELYDDCFDMKRYIDGVSTSVSAIRQ